MRELVAGRRVLVTGAGGTIGSELVRQAVGFGPAALTLLDSSEYALYSIDQEIVETAPAIDRRALIGDVRDRARVAEVMRAAAPDIEFHAAALKHMPRMEANITDAVLSSEERRGGKECGK